MPESEKGVPDLSTAEWEVMKVLWDLEAGAARDVFAALPDQCDWAYKTVKTLLSRLVAKGAIDYQQIGNSYLYRPAVSRERMTRREIHDVLQRVRCESLSPVLAHFIEQGELSEQDIQQLQRLLDEKRAGNTGRRPRRKGKSS